MRPEVEWEGARVCWHLRNMKRCQSRGGAYPWAAHPVRWKSRDHERNDPSTCLQWCQYVVVASPKVYLSAAFLIGEGEGMNDHMHACMHVAAWPRTAGFAQHFYQNPGQSLVGFFSIQASWTCCSKIYSCCFCCIFLWSIIQWLYIISTNGQPITVINRCIPVLPPTFAYFCQFWTDVLCIFS